jgi:hypothetical protein
VRRGLAVHAAGEGRHRECRVEGGQGLRRDVDLPAADVGAAVQELAVEVAQLDAVVVDQQEVADAGAGERRRGPCPQAADADDRHARPGEPELQLRRPAGRHVGEVRELAVLAGRPLRAQQPLRGAVRLLEQAEPGELVEGRLDLRHRGPVAEAGEPLGQLAGGARALAQERDHGALALVGPLDREVRLAAAAHEVEHAVGGREQLHRALEADGEAEVLVRGSGHGFWTARCAGAPGRGGHWPLQIDSAGATFRSVLRMRSTSSPPLLDSSSHRMTESPPDRDACFVPFRAAVESAPGAHG